jgi:ABC-type amino acid transport substrate-binding protein
MAQSPVTLTVYDPTGAFEVTQTFADRVPDLNGKTICEVTDASWEADRTFPVIQDLLQKQFPTAKIVTYDKLPTLSTGIDIPGLEDAVKKAGCQAAIVGNAG